MTCPGPSAAQLLAQGRGPPQLPRARMLLPSGAQVVNVLNIVWFKRDLRVQDHAALAKAAAQDPVLRYKPPNRAMGAPPSRTAGLPTHEERKRQPGGDQGPSATENDVLNGKWVKHGEDDQEK